MQKEGEKLYETKIKDEKLNLPEQHDISQSSTLPESGLRRQQTTNVNELWLPVASIALSSYYNRVGTAVIREWGLFIAVVIIILILQSSSVITICAQLNVRDVISNLSNSGLGIRQYFESLDRFERLLMKIIHVHTCFWNFANCTAECTQNCTLVKNELTRICVHDGSKCGVSLFKSGPKGFMFISDLALTRNIKAALFTSLDTMYLATKSKDCEGRWYSLAIGDEIYK
uniref:Uncharacterized protein n=1 Tax=Glossina brevipalpis TaxID=37001 RepID=A0A1A9WQU1_9MUSC